jgi:Uma2 family endonuclease
MAANPSDPPRRFFTLDEYFALEHAGDARYEYWDGNIMCMSGGSYAHSRIASNTHGQLARKLAGGPCVAFTEGLAVKTPTLLPYRYPDVSVVCGEPRVENIYGVEALLNPVLIVEVLSPATEAHDRGNKFIAYQQILAFQEYLLIEQQDPLITHYTRRQDGVWLREDVAGIAALIRLSSIGIELPLAEIYEGVALGANTVPNP